MLRGLFLALVVLGLSSSASAAAPKPVTVVFTVSEMANVMDIAGSWEVFQDVADDNGQSLFRLIVVGKTRTPVHLTGGMTVTPDYTFAEAPKADIVVIGAQMASPELTAFLKRKYQEGATLMSVCTGAFQLASTGLLDGKRATTHHDFFASFAKKYPKVTLMRGDRYVESGERLYTAGGLTSGVDLSLHMVELRLGHKTAAGVANYMEYGGTGWMHPKGASPVTD
jgi:transcriptional regulator GlxA family with amidase domain